MWKEGGGWFIHFIGNWQRWGRWLRFRRGEGNWGSFHSFLIWDFKYEISLKTCTVFFTFCSCSLGRLWNNASFWDSRCKMDLMTCAGFGMNCTVFSPFYATPSCISRRQRNDSPPSAFLISYQGWAKQISHNFHSIILQISRGAFLECEIIISVDLFWESFHLILLCYA